MSNQATRFVRYACWMVLIATLVVMHPAAAGAIDLPPADHRLLFLLQDNDEFVSLSRKDFGAPDWRVATVPIPASTAYNLWASRPIERPSGEYWVFFNAYAWYILGDFDYRNVTIGYAIYAYHPDTNTWSLILDRLDSRINVDDVMALDDGSIAMTYYGYDSETHFIRTNGWSVSNVGVWDSEADTVSWSPAWNVGVSWFAEFVHDYLLLKGNAAHPTIWYDNTLQQKVWRYDGAGWVRWSGPPALGEIGRVWPISQSEDWFYGDFSSGKRLAHRVRGVVTYRDLPGVCGSAFDPKHVRYGAYAMADGSPLVVVTAAGFASLDDHGDWICDAVPSIPWSFDLLTARGPGDIVFLGRGYQQPDWFLYRYVGGNVIRFDLPPGYEDYYISSATWVK